MHHLRAAGVVVLVFIAAVAPAAEYTNTDDGNRRVESLVYADIARYTPHLVSLCDQFSVDPSTVVAILYAEKVQYELDVLRSGKRELERLVETFPAFMSDLYTWSQLTAGYTHIKEAFAQETRERLDATDEYRGFLTEDQVDPAHYIRRPETALAVTVAGLAMLTDQWADHPNGCDISGMPGVLATLYNIGYRNSHPKPNPQLGGSEMPIIIDGTLIDGLNFGQRVLRLCTESEVHADFVRTFIEPQYRQKTHQGEQL